MKIDFIGVPLYQGCDIKGVELGPEIIRNANIIKVLNDLNLDYQDLGNISFPSNNQNKYENIKNIKYFETILNANKVLSNTVYNSLKNNRFPFMIGGDHSLAMGSISGSSKYHNNLGVIWIDAHTDINTDKTSFTHNSHGMPLSAAIGLGNEEFKKLFKNKINPKNIYIIGARDIDQGEYEIIKNHNVNVYEFNEVKEKGLVNIINNVLNELQQKNLDGVHLSFDIDSIDPTLAPATGVPVANGFTIEEAKLLLKSFFESRLISSFDFVEYNPLLDIDFKTRNVCIELLTYIFKTIETL